MLKKTLAVGVATAASLAMFASSRVVNAAPADDKVRICHRTHSVTNPYVRVTVNQRSVGTQRSRHGGGAHDDYATTLYTTKPNPNVFDPSKTYPPNDKKWGDIVDVADVSGNPLTGSAASAQGLNNTGIGALIFNGTAPYTGLCRTMNARDYYEIEKQAGIDPTEILTEMDEFDAPEFASSLAACGGSFIGCDPVKLGTPSIDISTTTTAPPTATTIKPSTSASKILPAGKTLAAGKGAVEVKIWVDANRNSKKSSTEKFLKNVSVTVTGPNGVTKTAKSDSDGYVLFLNLDPGSWTVKSVLAEDGLEKVYDSDGAVDWTSNVSVTAGSVASARYAAAPLSTLPATGTPLSLWLALLGIGSLLAGLMFRRRLLA